MDEVTKAQVLEYVNSYIGTQLVQLTENINRQFDDIKQTLSDFRADFVTKDVLAQSLATSIADREKLWERVRLMETVLANDTVSKEIHNVKCQEMSALAAKVAELEKQIWKWAGGIGVAAFVLSFIADKLF